MNTSYQQEQYLISNLENVLWYYNEFYKGREDDGSTDYIITSRDLALRTLDLIEGIKVGSGWGLVRWGQDKDDELAVVINEIKKNKHTQDLVKSLKDENLNDLTNFDYCTKCGDVICRCFKEGN